MSILTQVLKVNRVALMEATTSVQAQCNVLQCAQLGELLEKNQALDWKKNLPHIQVWCNRCSKSTLIQLMITKKIYYYRCICTLFMLNANNGLIFQSSMLVDIHRTQVFYPTSITNLSTIGMINHSIFLKNSSPRIIQSSFPFHLSNYMSTIVTTPLVKS